MKVRSSVKLICKHCKFIHRKGILRVKCELTGRHNQRKGYCTTSCYCHSLNKIENKINNNQTNFSDFAQKENQNVNFNYKEIKFNNMI